jgi:hypothetical protein
MIDEAADRGLLQEGREGEGSGRWGAEGEVGRDIGGTGVRGVPLGSTSARLGGGGQAERTGLLLCLLSGSRELQGNRTRSGRAGDRCADRVLGLVVVLSFSSSRRGSL